MDRRAEILSTIEALLATVNPSVKVFRNRGELKATQRPAFVLFDADEGLDLPTPEHRGAIPAGGLLGFGILRPELFYLHSDISPTNQDIGAIIGDMRVTLIKLIFSSATLQELVGSNGAIRYEGAMTDLADGRMMTGQLQVKFAFRYPLKLTDL